jgi:hypothetical protein
VIDIGYFSGILTELVGLHFGCILEHHQGNFLLIQNLVDDAKVIIAITTHIATELGSPHETRDGLVVLAVLEVVGTDHEKAVGYLQGFSPEDAFNDLSVDLVYLHGGHSYCMKNVSYPSKE